MTQNLSSQQSDEYNKPYPGRRGGGTAMRVIVPLRGVVQGTGGLFLGSVIPCALFYFLQLYLKRRHRTPPNSPPPSFSSDATSSPPCSPSTSSDKLTEVAILPRSLSRILLSPRGGSSVPYLSSRANSIVRAENSPYILGLQKVAEDSYHRIDNPNGVIQLGLAENKLSLDLVQDWLVKNASGAIVGGQEDCRELNISGITLYQPNDGLTELKVVIHIESFL